MNDEDENLYEQDESGMQDQIEQAQNAVNTVNQAAQKSKAISKAAARAPGMALKATGQVVETTGKVLEITGKGMQVAGKFVQNVGKGMQQAGKGIYNGSKALFDAGQAACGTGVGAIAGIPMMLAGILGMGIGKATELLGKAVEIAGKIIEKLGKVIEKAGKALAKLGKHIKALGDKAMQAANAASGAAPVPSSNLAGGGSEGDSDSSSGIGTGKIPSLTKKKSKIFRIIGIAIIPIIVLVILILCIEGSIVDDGTYEDGNNRNVPYVVSSYVMDDLVIVNDNTGNYTYAFKNEEGQIVSLEEAVDDAIQVLLDNESNSLSNLGTTRESQKELITAMIQAEIATQYPDLSLNEDLGLDTSTASYETGNTEDYGVDIRNNKALPAVKEDELEKIINSSSMSDKAKNNILPLIPDIISYQEKYKVNAVFFISVINKESHCGTAWDLIDESTYNWASVKGTDNGGYVDRDGTSWNKYNSYQEATEAWFKLISSTSGSYYGAQKDTVYKIGAIYCNLEWANDVASYIEEFYGYIGVTPPTMNTIGAGTNAISGQKTGDFKITEVINQDETVHGGIKIQRKDENGNLVDLKYTSTDNFNALVAANNSDSLNYYTLVKTGGNSSSVSNFSGNTNSEIVWNFLRSKGLSESCAAAIIGNLMQESGENIDPGIVEGGTGIGYGIAQWSFGRRTQLENYAVTMNKDVSSIELQLEFLWTEIDPAADHTYSDLQWGSGSHGWNGESLYNQFIGMTDVDEATAFFCWAHERPSVAAANLANRQRCANNVYALYSGTTPSSSSSNSNSSSSTVATSGSFVDIAKQCHAYLREKGYTYNYSGRSLPVEEGDCGYIDCSAYVSMVLSNYGIQDWSGYPHQLTVETLKNYAAQNFQEIYNGRATNVSQLPNLQPGDIIIQTPNGAPNSSELAHTQIFYGYNGNGDAIWLNCGGNDSIARLEGEDAYNDFSNQPILYVYRVKGGSSGPIVQSLDNFLFIGDSRYEGIESQLTALGNNITAIGVGSSMPKNWSQPVLSGGGIVYRGETTTDGEDIGTLPTDVSGVSVMLGVNGVNGTTQIDRMQTLIYNLHTKYPNAPIFVNSVYHLGTSYGNATDSMNLSVDKFNQAMKEYCNKFDWAYYIDVTENLDDASGYLKAEYSGDGLHISSTEGITTLVNNIESKILNSGATNISSNTSANNRPGYSLVVANRRDVNTIVINEYDYKTTMVTHIGQGVHEDPSARRSPDIPTETVVNETVTTYSPSTIDYQTSLQNFTLYFDFLWAILCDSGNTDFVTDWANLAYDSENLQSKVIITTYNDISVSQSGPTKQSKGLVFRSSGNLNGINYTDSYNVTETTTITTTTLTSKPCITNADTWLIKYENDASSYSEYKSKAQEVVIEKTDINSTDQNIIKLLKSRIDILETLTKEQYMVEKMLESNEKVAFMIDIYDYILKIANNEDKSQIGFDLNSLLNTNLFDLTTKQNTASTKVLLYDSISISDSDKELLYKTVEKICESYGTSDENYQRKKYITSVILNRVLSSEFPNSVSEVVNQEYQFENFEPSMLADQITISEESKNAVNDVLVGGDCSQYSVYFAKPSTAKSNSWDTLYKYTVNDGDGSDSSFNYYTTQDIIAELKRYEVTITGSHTKSSGIAQNIVNWANAQIGKAQYFDSYFNTTAKSDGYCAQFVKCAYYEAGLEYIPGEAKDVPHPNPIKIRSDGTVDWTDIPVGAIISSEGTPHNGVIYGHVALYIGNGYVIEAGGDIVRKNPIDQSYGAGKFNGWGFAMTNQDEAYEKLVVTIGSNYAEGWTHIGTYNEISDGIAGIYKLDNKTYKVYVQGYKGNAPWSNNSYSQGTYESSACGATSVAIIATGYGHEVTPPDVGAVIYKSIGKPNGSKTREVTTNDSLSKALNNYGITHRWSSSATQAQIIEHLKQGKPLIMHINNYTIGNNTYDGHYITLLGINAHGQIFLGDSGRGGNNNGYYDTSKIFTANGPYDVCFIDQ